MIVNLPTVEGDDETFLTAINGLLARVVDEHAPSLVHLVRITNWFDHKWLQFSGIGRVAFPWGEPYISTALAEFKREQLTFPPFNPNRIADERVYELVLAKAYRRTEAPRLVHKSELETSAANLQNRVSGFCRSGLFAWVSSNSKPNRRASLMVYGVEESATTAWYASFLASDSWRVGQTKGIDRDVLLAWFPTRAA